MNSAKSSTAGRCIVYAPELRNFLDRPDKVFRIDATTIGVADHALASATVSARPVLPSERSVFKPVAGTDIDDETAMQVIRALGHDVMASIDRPPPEPGMLVGPWPHAGIAYLRQWLYAGDGAPFSMLSLPAVVGSHAVSRVADVVTSVWPMTSGAGDSTALASLVRDATSTRERRRAAALYRRASAVLCEGVSGLVANALWLMTPADERSDRTSVLWETLRLLPPAWMLWRTGTEEYAALHPSIRPEDDVALFPLLMHRDPDLWPEPEVFRPGRWTDVVAERIPGFMPFGLAGARCWARHLILPLAERLLSVVLQNDVIVQRPKEGARVPLRPLLAVRFELARTV